MNTGARGDSDSGHRGCEGIRLLLVPYVDGETDAAEGRQVEDHVSSCSSCARDLELHRQVRKALGPALSAPAPVLSAGVHGGAPAAHPGAVLVRRIRERYRRRRIVRVFQAAAVLLIASGLVFLSVRARPVHNGNEASDELITQLDILEDLQSAGVEPSRELVNLILEGAKVEGGQEEGEDPVNSGDLDEWLEGAFATDNL